MNVLYKGAGESYITVISPYHPRPSIYGSVAFMAFMAKDMSIFMTERSESVVISLLFELFGNKF